MNPESHKCVANEKLFEAICLQTSDPNLIRLSEVSGDDNSVLLPRRIQPTSTFHMRSSRTRCLKDQKENTRRRDLNPTDSEECERSCGVGFKNLSVAAFIFQTSSNENFRSTNFFTVEIPFELMRPETRG